MNVCFNSCKDMSLKTKNINPMAVVEEKLLDRQS